MEYLKHPATYYKAIIGTLLALLGAVQATLEALPDGASWGDISTLGWVIIAGITVATFGSIFGVQNADRPEPPSPETELPPVVTVPQQNL